MKKGQITFTRSRKLMGIRKAPGPSGTTIWMVHYWPSVQEVFRGKDRQYLGNIYWFSKWRGYAFFSAPETVFSPNCQRTIAAFCEQQSDRLRKRLKN